MAGGPRHPCRQQPRSEPVPALSDLFRLLPELQPRPEIVLAVQALVQEGSRGLQAPEEPGDALSSRASWSGFGLSDRRLEVRDGPPTEGAQRLLHLVGEFGSTMVGARR